MRVIHVETASMQLHSRFDRRGLFEVVRGEALEGHGSVNVPSVALASPPTSLSVAQYVIPFFQHLSEFAVYIQAGPRHKESALNSDPRRKIWFGAAPILRVEGVDPGR